MTSTFTSMNDITIRFTVLHIFILRGSYSYTVKDLRTSIKVELRLLFDTYSVSFSTFIVFVKASVFVGILYEKL